MGRPNPGERHVLGLTWALTRGRQSKHPVGSDRMRAVERRRLTTPDQERQDHTEYNASALVAFADMEADIDFCRSGPKQNARRAVGVPLHTAR